MQTPIQRSIEQDSCVPYKRRQTLRNICLSDNFCFWLRKRKLLFKVLRYSAVVCIFSVSSFLPPNVFGQESIRTLGECLNRLEPLWNELVQMGMRVGYQGPYNPISPYTGYNTDYKICMNSLRNIQRNAPGWARHMQSRPVVGTPGQVDRRNLPSGTPVLACKCYDRSRPINNVPDLDPWMCRSGRIGPSPCAMSCPPGFEALAAVCE